MRRAWQPIPVFLPGKSHGQRSLAGYSPWGCKESDPTEGTEHARQDQLKSIPWGWKGCPVPDVIGCLPAASAPHCCTVSRQERKKLFWGQLQKMSASYVQMWPFYFHTFNLKSHFFFYPGNIFPHYFLNSFLLSFLFFLFRMLQNEY